MPDTIENEGTRAARYDWLKENVFEYHWDGTIGRPPRWVAHRAFGKLQGNTLEEAIDAAIEKENKNA